MKQYSYTNKSKQKIVFYDSKFEFFKNPQKKIEFEFEKMSNFSISYNENNWLVSIISIIVDLFLGTATGGFFGNKFLNIKFIYNMKKKHVLKIKIPNKQKAEEVIIKFKSYIKDL